MGSSRNYVSVSHSLRLSLCISVSLSGRSGSLFGNQIARPVIGHRACSHYICICDIYKFIAALDPQTGNLFVLIYS